MSTFTGKINFAKDQIKDIENNILPLELGDVQRSFVEQTLETLKKFLKTPTNESWDNLVIHVKYGRKE